MIRSSLKIALRSFTKSITFSLINLFGLSIALALFILLILFASNELQTDKYHNKSDRIYRLAEREKQFTFTGAKFAQYINESYPEVEEVCRTYITGGDFSSDAIETHIDKVALADSNYFKIFTHELLLGDFKNALNGDNGLILTESESKKLFGDENPIGKVVQWSNTINLVVNAVIKDLPINSSMQVEAFASFMCLKWINHDALYSDGNWSVMTWLMLKENTKYKNLETKISPDLATKFGQNTNFGLQNLEDIYFNNSIVDRNIRHGNIQLVYLFIGLAIFILILACINYINLTTASANTRAKEVGVRKVVGANKTKLRTQFLTESCTLVFISLIFGFLLAEFFIPTFNLLANTSLTIKTFYELRYIIGFLIGVLLLGIISGLYPALLLSSFRPVEVLKGENSKSKNGLLARRVLLIFQFVISMIMIVGAIIIYRQVDYVKHLDLGFNKEQIIHLRTRDNLVKKSNSFKDEILAVPGVEIVSVCQGIPGDISNGMAAEVEGEEIFMKHLRFDENYLELMGINLIDGIGFTADSTDIGKNYLINEAAVKQFGWEDPYEINLWGMKCIGIVNDFNFASLHQPIGPLFMTYNPSMRQLVIRFTSTEVSRILQDLEDIWNNHYSEDPFKFEFVDDIVDQQYRTEEQLGKIIGYFAFFALIIATLGLLGLTAFMIQSRTKEIGIRKVHGGSTTDILKMFSFDFLKWLCIAFIISIPISWYLMDFWLQNFAYRVSIDWWVFALSGLISLLISLITIISLTYRATVMNPVDSLRYE